MQKCAAQQQTCEHFCALLSPRACSSVYLHVQIHTHISVCSDRLSQVSENKCRSTNVILRFILSSTIPVFSAACLHLLPLPSSPLSLTLFHLFLLFLSTSLPWTYRLFIVSHSCFCLGFFFPSVCLVWSNFLPLLPHRRYRALSLPSLSPPCVYVCVLGCVYVCLFESGERGGPLT